jgi:hypothetical protein
MDGSGRSVPMISAVDDKRARDVVHWPRYCLRKEGEECMRIRHLGAFVLLLALIAALVGAPRETSAARHHFYVGTITRISATSLTIHSKAHVIDAQFNPIWSAFHYGRPAAVHRGIGGRPCYHRADDVITGHPGRTRIPRR